jgi:hypothetical protein
LFSGGEGGGGNVLFCSAPASKSQLDFISQLVYPRVGRATTFYIFVRYRFTNGLKYHKKEGSVLRGVLYIYVLDSFKKIICTASHKEIFYLGTYFLFGSVVEP